MNRKTILVFVTWALTMTVFCLGFIFGKTIEPKPEPMQVVAKYEHAGKCYIETWIEVTPEQYIGLDVGDEFEVTE